LPVAQSVPLVAGEVGLTDDCSTRMPTAALPFLDQHRLSYLAWTWNDWHDCSSLLADDTTTALTAWGTMYRDHVAGLPVRRSG
jgi:endoglucanase